MSKITEHRNALGELCAVTMPAEKYVELVSAQGALRPVQKDRNAARWHVYRLEAAIKASGMDVCEPESIDGPLLLVWSGTITPVSAPQEVQS